MQKVDNLCDEEVENYDDGEVVYGEAETEDEQEKEQNGDKETIDTKDEIAEKFNDLINSIMGRNVRFKVQRTNAVRGKTRSNKITDTSQKVRLPTATIEGLGNLIIDTGTGATIIRKEDLPCASKITNCPNAIIAIDGSEHFSDKLAKF